MKYYVCEISGRQYLVEPGKPLLIESFTPDKKIKVDKILLKVDDDRIDLGTPYLKSDLELEVMGKKRVKIRVATYKSKANHRRVIGSVHYRALVKLNEGKTVVKNKD